MSNQKPHITGYDKGMNKDINVESLPENAYVDAKNFRLFTSGDGASVGGIQNIKGTKLVHTFSDVGGLTERVIGSTQLRDALIVFTAISTDEPDIGRIYKIEFDFIEEEISVNLLYESEDLQFTAAAPIEALAVHETNFIQRIYFSDFTRPTRSMNIADPNLENLPVSSFSVSPMPPIKKAQIDFVAGVGQLPVGVYNYTYYLVTPGGQKTLLAPVSNQVHIIEDDEGVGSTNDYQGSYTAPGNTIFATKSVSVTVDTSVTETNQFEKIVFVAIFLEEIGGTPSVYEFEEQLISGTQQEATHSGVEDQVTIPFADFLSERYAFITNKTFSAKDDTLFVGNVKTGGFTLSEQDAKGLQTKRYTKDIVANDDPYVNPFNDESGLSFGSNPNGSYDYWLNNYQYMFQDDGTTLGGTADYLSYTFFLKEIRGLESDVSPGLSNPGSIETFDLGGGYSDVNRTFRNFASPYKRTLRGYKRGETYRFGIIFFDKATGLPSPVYYVGDIKFPEMSQPFGTEQPGGEKEVLSPFTGAGSGDLFDHYAIAKKVGSTSATQLYSLGLNFSFNFPDSILNNIQGFQIVRVPRTPIDRTRLGQGVMSKYYNIDCNELNALGSSDMWGNGDHWPTRNSKSETFCPVAELPSLYGHLNRYYINDEDEDQGVFPAPRRGESVQFGLNFLNWTDGNENDEDYPPLPSSEGYHNGVAASHYVDYQSSFSTPGLVNFFCPEISYDYGLPAFRRGIDFLKTVGLYSKTIKRSDADSQLGYEGQNSKELGHVFQKEPPIINTDLDGQKKYRPRIADSDANGANFFNFPGAGSISESNRIFDTKAMQTDRLGREGDQSASDDISNPTTAAFNLSEAYETIEGYRIATTISPSRRMPSIDVNGAAVYKRSFQSGAPYGYFMKKVRQAHDGKSAVISLMENHRDVDDFFSSGLFIGRTTQLDSANTPNTFNPSATFTDSELQALGLIEDGETFSDLGGADEADVLEKGYAPSFHNSGDTFIVEHVRRVGEQYGGNGADAVFFNTFITCSDPVYINADAPVQPGTLRVFQGDTFVCMYQFMKNFWDNDYSENGSNYLGNAPQDTIEHHAFNASNSSTLENVMIPVETIVNIELGSGTRRFEGATVANLSYRVQEYPDFAEIGNDTSQGRSKFFHQYDGVFSEETVSKTYSALPAGKTEAETHFDVRTHYSGTKSLGEERDSWSSFAIADYKDLDPQYGPINRIINFKDTLFAFQDNGVGTYLINTRELLSGEAGAALSIGTGAGISDYKYISTEYGSINQFGVVKTDAGVYFIDAKRQKFFALGEQLMDMSETLGMNDFLRKNLIGDATLTREQGGDNPLLDLGSHMAYDPMNKEVLLTVLGNSGKKGSHFTLCFSEPLKAFSSFYSFQPRIYLQGNKKILSSNPGEDAKLHLHDSGPRGVFYDLDPEESSITIRVNSIGVANKIFRFLEYNSIVKNTEISSEPVSQDVGLSSIDIRNDYQNSGKISLEGRQKRRFRKWRVKLPRDANSQDALGRFRGTYFDVTLYFDNSVNLSIMLERIMSYYDVQIY